MISSENAQRFSSAQITKPKPIRALRVQMHHLLRRADRGAHRRRRRRHLQCMLCRWAPSGFRKSTPQRKRLSASMGEHANFDLAFYRSRPNLSPLSGTLRGQGRGVRHFGERPPLLRVRTVPWYEGHQICVQTVRVLRKEDVHRLRCHNPGTSIGSRLRQERGRDLSGIQGINKGPRLSSLYLRLHRPAQRWLQSC